ncbi:hypothetical protein GUJ93_ZPchr0014g47410 [Zizania palustris]|uniref:Uncharacterized protein n=1 Tax=Zizania palustris TaxID=103762 RepID=A0A8J5TEK3_ZIZPA|nr:hypothetical protein GUJ93_ZPchr0014g47410 [Zizania palustris]
MGGGVLARTAYRSEWTQAQGQCVCMRVATWMAYGRGRGVNGGYRRAVARAAQRYQRMAQALLTRVARERARRTGALARAQRTGAERGGGRVLVQPALGALACGRRRSWLGVAGAWRPGVRPT